MLNDEVHDARGPLPSCQEPNNSHSPLALREIRGQKFGNSGTDPKYLFHNSGQASTSVSEAEQFPLPVVFENVLADVVTRAGKTPFFCTASGSDSSSSFLLKEGSRRHFECRVNPPRIVVMDVSANCLNEQFYSLVS